MPVRAAVVGLAAFVTYAAACVLLAALGIGFTAGQLGERGWSEAYASANRAGSVGLVIYLWVLCIQAGIISLMHATLRKRGLTVTLGYFVVYYLLAFAASMVFALLLAELSEKLGLIRFTIDLAARVIRQAGKL